MHGSEKWKWRHSVVSNSSPPHGLQPTRLLRPWDFPGKSTGVGCHCLLQHTPYISIYGLFEYLPKIWSGTIFYMLFFHESWTTKKAEHQRIDAFELWCWRRLLRVPWTARRSNLSILKEIRPECSLEGLMLKLKLQYFGHLMWRADSFEKTLVLGKIEGRRRRGWQRMMVGWYHWLDGHEFKQAPGVGNGQGSLECCCPWDRKESDRTELLNWTEKNYAL